VGLPAWPVIGSIGNLKLPSNTWYEVIFPEILYWRRQYEYYS
jgi:hypothetical protein